MSRWLVEAQHSVPLRRWIMADGPSQAAATYGELQICVGNYTVVVHAENGESFAFQVQTAIGQPTRVRWIRDWANLGARPAGRD